MAAKSKTNIVQENESVVIKPPNLQTVLFDIEGDSPLVMNKFSEKARHQMMEAQMAGSRSKSRKTREAKDFDACFRQAIHVAEEGWYGIPASAFRSAMIDACRLVGFKMTLAKQAIFVVGDGLDVDEGTPLVKLDAGEPERHEGYVRNATGVADIRVRPMWRKWKASVIVQFDADVFSRSDIANLLLRAGKQVGICEGRPFSKSSHGLGWGMFSIT